MMQYKCTVKQYLYTRQRLNGENNSVVLLATDATTYKTLQACVLVQAHFPASRQDRDKKTQNGS